MTKKVGKKERKTWVTGVTKDVVSSVTVTYDPNSDTMQLHEADPASLRTGVSYDRESGKEKVLNSVPSLSADASFSVWGAIASQFDYLAAVDTNTIFVDGRRLSVTASYCVVGNLRTSAPPMQVVPLGAYAVFDVAGTTNPERIGWHLVLTNEVRRQFPRKLSLALLTDTELGLHSKINDRTIPYYGAHPLPDSVSLLYGSDTEGTFPNVMLRYCHDTAAEALQKLALRHLQLSVPSNGDGNFSGFVPLNLRFPP